MSKLATKSVINPATVGLGAPVIYDAIVATIEQLNWSFSQRPSMLFTWCAKGGDAGSPALCPIVFDDNTVLFLERLRTRIYVNEDAQEILIGVRAFMDSGDSGDVKVTVGGADHEFSFDDTATTESTYVLSTEDTGTGWMDLIVELRMDEGFSTEGLLLGVRAQERLIIVDPCIVYDEEEIVYDDDDIVRAC